MSFFPWSDEYSVHLRVIDNDHKDLVNTVNELHDAISGGGKREEIGRIIGTLAQYVDEHFSREEALMESNAYPDVAGHKRIHRHLARQVYAIRTIFGSKPQLIDPAKLLRFLRDWLVHHILEEDRKYVPYLRGVAAQSMPAEEPAARAHSETAIKDEATETLSITVPASKAAALRRCARFLTEDGLEAIAIEDLVMPIGHMTYEEAVHFAGPSCARMAEPGQRAALRRCPFPRRDSRTPSQRCPVPSSIHWRGNFSGCWRSAPAGHVRSASGIPGRNHDWHPRGSGRERRRLRSPYRRPAP